MSYPLYYSNIRLYKTIEDVLANPINISRLPITVESKIFKQSAGRYGHIILKLDLNHDDDIDNYGRDRFSYNWEVDENYIPTHEGKLPIYSILPISRQLFEVEIVKELQFFTGLFCFLNEDETPLRFSIIGGSYKANERPYFSAVTAEAIVKIFKQLLEN